MAKLLVGTRTLQLLEANVAKGYVVRQTATQVGPGLWFLDVDDDVADHIEARRLPGENNDEAIERLTSLAKRGHH